tara:strand:- start:156 stop:962 length:807 start_codon:yes stop_codon:yes gene_type:complete
MNVKRKIRMLSVICPILAALFIQFAYPLVVNAEENLQVIFDQALQESKNGNFVEAINDWNRFLQQSPSNAAALSNRGNCFLALGEPNQAIRDHSRAIELLPFEPDSYLNRGIAEEVLQLWDEASNDYEWILEHYPDDSSALFNLGNVKGSQGDWEMAKILFAKASFVKPGFAVARSSNALALYQLGEFEEAESELRSIIRRYPMFADARAALSALLWMKGANGEAESHWAAVIGLDNNYQNQDWLLNIRRWPPGPTKDLMTFLNLEQV